MSVPITLNAGAFHADVYPAIGGVLGLFTWRRQDGQTIDLLRPMHRHAVETGNSEGASCFPLFPFSNRIRDSRFSFDGHEIVLTRNTNGPHIEHGHGWQRPWSILATDDSSATIGFTHDPVGDRTWPFAYAAQQQFTLDEAGLSVTLLVRNLDHRRMPVGFGLHPYFLSTPLCKLQANVSGFWETDQEVLPTRHRDVPSGLDPRPGLAMNDVVIDNVFTGFEGDVAIVWPEWRTRLTMTAGDPLRFLVLYVPDAATSDEEAAAGIPPYFCAEPVSNITNAFNLVQKDAHPETGTITLAPGAEATATVRFQPEMI